MVIKYTPVGAQNSSNQSVCKSFKRIQEETDEYKDLTARKSFPQRPVLPKRLHNFVRLIVSYAFRKSMKAQKVGFLAFFRVSVILVNETI